MLIIYTDYILKTIKKNIKRYEIVFFILSKYVDLIKDICLHLEYVVMALKCFEYQKL